jgi:hypothetical protein
MDHGKDFLKAQVNNAVALHKEFVRALDDHASQAEDQRFRDLCSRHLPMMRSHQQALEEYQEELGAAPGTFKKAVGATMGMARDLADAARESDFLRLVGDIVLSRQCEDTLKTFREAGRQLGIAQLASIGEVGERDHDAYNRDANRLVQTMFVELARDASSERSASVNVGNERPEAGA